jgi:hypothetical protein
MANLRQIASHLAFSRAERLSLPEHRQIELYTKRKTLGFSDPDGAEAIPVEAIARLCRCAFAMEAIVSARQPTDKPFGSWARCLELPRKTQTDKIIAEFYRMLRIVTRVAFHDHGHIDLREEIVCLNGAIDNVALSLEITAAGLNLIESAIAYWLQAKDGPYPAAYIEAMLAEYFGDIVGEIKRFADEDRILYQFRKRYAFNRHFRLECDNPRTEIASDRLMFEIGDRIREPARYPIDFFVVHDDLLHIVPVETLKDGGMPLDVLPAWRARTPDGLSLPYEFRSRFARERIVVGQPMT